MKNESLPVDNLQLQQHIHDKIAHADILGLSVDRRVTHMVLHFAKYVGRCFSMEQSDKAAYKKLVVDTAIIALACANALQIRLQDHDDFVETEGFDGLDFSDPKKFGSAIAVPTSKMAKAAESLDHLEDYPYRRCFEENTAKVAGLAFSAARDIGLGLPDAIRNKWAQIESNRKGPLSSDESNAACALREAS